MQTAVYGASVATSLFGKVGFTFNNGGQLLELSWRKGFSEEASQLAQLRAPCPSLPELRKYIEDYARGCGPQFPGAYVFPQAAAFSIKVYKVVEKLKPGQSFSYQQVAELAGSSKACRAVGNIMGKNPLPLVIPWHRVLASGQGLGGFTGGVAFKRLLLDAEGIEYGA